MMSSPNGVAPSVGSLLRSEDMSYISCTMTTDSAHATITALGKFGGLHLVDLNSHTKEAPAKQQVFYKKRLADCLFWEKKLGYFKEEMRRRGVVLPGYEHEPSEVKTGDILESVQQVLDPVEQELSISASFQRDNQKQMYEIKERRYVLQVCKQVSVAELKSAVHDLLLSSDAQTTGNTKGEIKELERNLDSSLTRPLSSSPGGTPGIEMKTSKAFGSPDDEKLRNFVCGVVPTSNTDQFKRMLYRISRGNALLKFHDIEEVLSDLTTGEPLRKSVFWIVFLGQQLQPRVKKMCEILRATIYDLPDRSIIDNEVERCATDLADKVGVNARTEESIGNLLQKLAWDKQTSLLLDFESALSREKTICDVFMKSHFYLTLVAIEGFVATFEIPTLRQAVRDAVQGTGNPPAALEIDPVAPIKEPESKPTFFRTNKFTGTFQGIVDTYGIPRYKEINPGLFTITSFPFLFGVMYGDIGHGVILTIFAALMIWREDALERSRKAGTLGEIPTMAFGGRYIIICMGLFATYVGTIYNDCLSIPISTFSSTWFFANDTEYNGVYYTADNATYLSLGTVYPYGMDPIWAHQSNELAFYNSMKMKMAVILGVTQMSFAILLSLGNHLYYKDYVSAIWEFIPRFLFLQSTFGYMIFMIIYKWTIDWSSASISPPNLIQTMIAMFLSPGSVSSDKLLYVGQPTVQAVLLLTAVFSVPVMLFMKPCIHKRRHKKQQQSLNVTGAAHQSDSEQPIGLALHGTDNGNGANGSNGADFPEGTGDEEKKKVDVATVEIAVSSHGGGHEEFNFSDELIHNSIHTIEYVLGTVSNTASYLRLWALSLAHAELAEVFWDKMILQYGITNGSGLWAFLGFAIWGAATFAVLLSMDVLECFLHALRLHWVEFQNKFFYADGKPFEPFNFIKKEE